jgi:multisubunit Na+/H+ antiporter MnhB subunit
VANRTKAVALAAATVIALALGVGCSSSDKKSSETTTTRKEAGFTIATPDGTASLSLNGSLPDGWPSDFPIPDNADVAGSGSVGGASSGTMAAVYTVSGDPSDTFDFYKTNTAFHVTSASGGGVGNAFVGSVQFDGAFTGSVTLAGRNSKAYLAIVLKTGTDATTTTVAGETTTTGIVS